MKNSNDNSKRINDRDKIPSEHNKSFDDYNKMLDDVLLDEGMNAFRENLLNECKEELKVRKPAPTRKWLIPLAAAAMILVMLKVFFITGDPKSTGTSPDQDLIADHKPSFFVTQTIETTEVFLASATLDEADWKCTPEPIDDLIVQSDPTQSFQVVTMETQDFTISDSEMLAFFKDTPCGLIDNPNNGMTLFFMNEDDESRFLTKLD